MNDTLIKARGLTKRYGEAVVVDGIDFEVEYGEFFGILGPNGAGKTTTLRMLLGHTPPNAGELEVMGYVLPDQGRRMRAKLGIVPQHDNLDPDFTVRENLLTYASYFRLPRSTIRERIPELLQFAALETKADARISALSGGMQRRLTLARALINDPELLVLDEPTTGLDPQARQVIWQRLRMLKSRGKTLILTTHYMEEAERLCDRLVIMERGRILVSGAPAQLVRDHIEPVVVEVYGEGAHAWGEAFAAPLSNRVEYVGESVLCYTGDETPLLNDLQQRHVALEFHHRRANLEDVFLKLTGRELREG